MFPGLGRALQQYANPAQPLTTVGKYLDHLDHLL